MICPCIEECSKYSLEKRYNLRKKFRCHHKEYWSKCPFLIEKVGFEVTTVINVNVKSLQKTANRWKTDDKIPWLDAEGLTVFKNLGTHRSRLDIIASILTITKKNGIGITKIMYGANLNFKQLKQYMELLVEKGLLRTSDTDSKKRYQTTMRGIELLKNYEKIQKRLMEI